MSEYTEREFPYDVEILGGIPVTGTCGHDRGRIEWITLPNGDKLETGSGSRQVCRTHSTNERVIGNLILDQLYISKFEELAKGLVERPHPRRAVCA